MTRWAALLCFLLSLGFYLVGLSPSAYWLDSSEFAAAAFVLGVPHPPGHPLAALLGKAVALLPLGPVAFRVGLSQALCAAAGSALLCVAGAHLSARARAALFDGCAPSVAPADVLIGAGAALCSSLGYAVAFQAVRPEVYALHRLIALSSLLCLLRYDQRHDRRDLALAALILGLGLTNHHFLTLLLCAPVPLLLRRRIDQGGPSPSSLGGASLLRDIALCCLAGALGLLLYAYLPVRAAQHPLVNWGAPSSWGRFVWTISAKAFQKSLRPPGGGDGDVVGALLEATHPLGALLGCFGAYVMVRQLPTRRMGLYLLLVVALYAGGRAVLGFDVANPDAYGYLAPGSDALLLLSCAGLGALGVALGRLWAALRGPGLRLLLRREIHDDPSGRGRISGALGLSALVLGTAWGAGSFSRVDRSGFWDLDLVLGGWLDESPPRARLLSSYFQTVFGLWYLRGVEGRRPDVEHLHPHFLGYPGHREDLLLRHRDSAELPALLGERWLRPQALLQSARRRPTVVEYDLETPAEVTPYLVPYGLMERLWPGATPAEVTPELLRAQRRRAALLSAVDRNEPETWRNLLWRTYVRATLACGQGDRLSFTAERARARALLRGGHSAELDELDRRCGGPPP